MRIGIPCFGGDGGRSGIGRYIIHLLRQLATVPEDFEFDVLVHASERMVYLPGAGAFHAIPVSESFRSPILNVAWHQAGLPRTGRRRGWDVLFLPAGNRRLPAMASCPTVGVVHDLSSFHVDRKYDPARMLYIKQVLPFLFRRLSLVITPSESTRRDLLEFAGVPSERVRTVPMGVDHDLFRPCGSGNPGPQLESKYGLRPPWILYVSRIEHPGKNHVRLIRAFERLKSEGGTDHQLVIAGSDWNRSEEVHRAARESPNVQDIVFTGFVDAVDLPWLYSGSEMVVFPSLYEGFGLPLLEAMACGAPVACSDGSSLPEVVGEAALLFDPGDVRSISDAMIRLCGDADLRRRLMAEGLRRCRDYNWQRTATETLEVLREAAAQA